MQTINELLDDLRERHQRAAREKNKAELAQVINVYEQMLNDAPEDPAVLAMLGTAIGQIGHWGESIQLLLRAKAYTPQSALIWNNLGAAWKSLQRNDKAEPCFMRALQLEPDVAEHYNNLASLYVNVGHPEQGLPWIDEALTRDPENDQFLWNKSLLLLEQGKWSEGFALYDHGINSRDRLVNTAGLPRWDEKTRQRVVVFGEQGMGDELMFASALPDLISKLGAENVIFDCHPRMEGLFKRSFPDIEIHGTRKKNERDWLAESKPDSYILIGSLFRIFRPEGQFPRIDYLEPDSTKVQAYRQRLAAAGPGPYIGIGYAAGSTYTNRAARSFKLLDLMPILKQNAAFVSLQYTPEAEAKFERFEQEHGIKIHHWPEAVQAFDYDETAALLAALDLAILPNTAAVHLAGAIGQPCWSLTPDACAWRYTPAMHDEMAFYGDWVTLYREHGDWKQAIDNVAADIARLFSEKSPKVDHG